METSFTLPYFNKRLEQGHGRVTDQYKRFLNNRTPTEFNREIVNQLLENLFDSIIHDRDNWERGRLWMHSPRNIPHLISD